MCGFLFCSVLCVCVRERERDSDRNYVCDWLTESGDEVGGVERSKYIVQIEDFILFSVYWEAN